jgi:hypothetical protein
VEYIAPVRIFREATFSNCLCCCDFRDDLKVIPQ